jgi:hypothetical protein
MIHIFVFPFFPSYRFWIGFSAGFGIIKSAFGNLSFFSELITAFYGVSNFL